MLLFILMKSLKVIFIVLTLLFLYFNSNAQVFVSGGIGMSSTGGSIENGDNHVNKTSTNSFNFYPAVGYFLSEEFAIGLQLSMETSRTVIPGAVETVNSSSSIGFSPFLRYYFFNFNDFSVFGKGSIGFSTGSSKSKSGDITAYGPKRSNFGLNVSPGIAYNIGQRVSLETNIGIFGLGYHHQTERQGDTRNNTSNFSFGAGLNNVINVGSITIGAIYRF